MPTPARSSLIRSPTMASMMLEKCRRGSSRSKTRLRTWPRALALHGTEAGRLLSGSSGKLCGLGQERDAGLTAGAMTAPLTPVEGMTMGVPVGRRLRDGCGDLVPGLEAAPGESQRAQHL